jgi:hypothetical protein
LGHGEGKVEVHAPQQAVGALAQRVGELDEQDAVVHDHADHHQRAHQPSKRLLLKRAIVTLVACGGKTMSLEMMIGNLSHDEKLAALDLIWRDLASDSQSFTSPRWHERVIADRLANPAPGPALPLAEAKAEIKEAIDASRASP